MGKLTYDYKKHVSFQYCATPGSTVYVAGAFNHWNPTQYMMTDNAGDGVFKTSIELESGSYEYKFVVNGIWHTDPNCKENVPNEYGTRNSVVTV